MEDFITTISEKADVAVGAAGAAGAWLATKFAWWKNSDSKLVKIGVPLGIFIAVAAILSLLN